MTIIYLGNIPRFVHRSVDGRWVQVGFRSVPPWTCRSVSCDGFGISHGPPAGGSPSPPGPLEALTRGRQGPGSPTPASQPVPHLPWAQPSFHRAPAPPAATLGPRWPPPAPSTQAHARPSGRGPSAPHAAACSHGEGSVKWHLPGKPPDPLRGVSTTLLPICCLFHGKRV